MGNMGILEWLIMLVILFIFFGVPLMLVLMMMYRRRSEERGMNAQDRMTMQRIMAALEQMEQRVKNMETILTRPVEPPDSGQA